MKALMVAAVVAASTFFVLGASETSAKPVECRFSGPKGMPDTSAEWAVFFQHKEEPFRTFDIDCNGSLSASEVAQITAASRSRVELAVSEVERLKAGGVQFKVTDQGEVQPPVLAATEPGKAQPTGWNFLLRDSFEDVSIFSRPKDVGKAKGATFSFSRDGTIDNELWSAKGVASIAYSTFLDTPDDPFEPYMLGFAVAPSISFNRQANSTSAKKSKDVDYLGFAATSEFGFANVLGGTQYFRLRPALITDFDGNSKSWSLVAEWQPLVDIGAISLSSPNGLGPFTWQLDPILRAHYAEELNNSGGALFDDNRNPLRIGPVLALTVAPKKGDGGLPSFLQQTSFFTSFEYLTDVETGREWPLFSAGLNWNIDRDGHTAIKLAYSKGRIEDTGEKVDLVELGLTAKW